MPNAFVTTVASGNTPAGFKNRLAPILNVALDRDIFGTEAFSFDERELARGQSLLDPTTRAEALALPRAPSSGRAAVRERETGIAVGLPSGCESVRRLPP